MRRGSFLSTRSPRLLISVLALGASLAFVVSSTPAQGQRPGKVDDAALRNAALGKGEDWLSYGFTPQETRYTPLSLINTSNVSRLGLAWSVEVGPGGGGQEATPLVHNGVIFSTTQWSVVFAVDARTGKEKWRWDPEVNQTALRPKICCGVVQRGLAMYDGQIIAAIDGRPERFAQEALGHNSKAVHRAYARKAKVELPSLGEIRAPAKAGCATNGRQSAWCRHEGEGESFGHFEQILEMVRAG